MSRTCAQCATARHAWEGGIDVSPARIPARGRGTSARNCHARAALVTHRPAGKRAAHAIHRNSTHAVTPSPARRCSLSRACRSSRMLRLLASIFAHVRRSTDSVAAGASSARCSSPVVVTAERGPQPLADAIPQTTLFDQQDIADTNATDLPGLLQLAPGAQITRNGGPGSTASLFLRGASSTQSLVLIDGVRVDSVSLGARATRADSARPDRSRRSGERQRVGVVRVGRDRRRGAGVHERRRQPSAALQLLRPSYGSYHTQRSRRA